MNWSRHKSNVEELMVAVLRKKKAPMSLSEIVDEINKKSPSAFNGKTPKNSLYSIIYRREKRRIEDNENPLFKTTEVRREIFYSLYK